jgi:hypothetical protein
MKQAFQLNQFVEVITLAPRGYRPPGFMSIYCDFFFICNVAEEKPKKL